MVDILGIQAPKKRDVYYYRARNKNRVFEKLVSFFAAEAERTGITKKALAEMLDRDPAQITRWLSAPGNLTLDSISDLLLALGAEMDYDVAKFSERGLSNFTHPFMPPAQITPSSTSIAANVVTLSSNLEMVSGSVQTTSVVEVENG